MLTFDLDLQNLFGLSLSEKFVVHKAGSINRKFFEIHVFKVLTLRKASGLSFYPVTNVVHETACSCHFSLL